MHVRTSCRGSRSRRALLFLAPSPLLVAGALVVALGMGSVPAVAGPISDANPGAAARTIADLVNVDATLRATALALPAAENAVATTAAAQAAARASEDQINAAGPPAPGGGAGGVVDNATNAVLDDLAPEASTNVRLEADQAAAAAVAQRDQLKAAYAAAATQRVQLIAGLAASGQHRAWWCVSLLDRLGFPVTVENLHGLYAWIEAESNAASLLNPLATTMGAPGARIANSVGVKGYPNDDIGLDATVRTLRNGNYPAILDALARGDSAMRLVQAVAASPWGTGVNAVRRLQMNGG